MLLFVYKPQTTQKFSVNRNFCHGDKRLLTCLGCLLTPSGWSYPANHMSFLVFFLSFSAFFPLSFLSFSFFCLLSFLSFFLSSCLFLSSLLQVFRSDPFVELSLGAQFAVTVMALPVPERWGSFYHSQIFSTRCKIHAHTDRRTDGRKEGRRTDVNCDVVFPACAEKNGLDQCSQGPPELLKGPPELGLPFFTFCSLCRLVPQIHSGHSGWYQRHPHL